MVEISVIVVTLRPKSEIDCIPIFNKSNFDDYEIVIRRDDGISKARNKGVEEATADKLVFIDDDAKPTVEYLSIVSSALEQHPIIAGKVVNPQDDIFSSYGADYDQGEESKYTTSIVGANMAFRREVFNNVGYFDENFQWGHEETEFAERTLYEYPIIYEPDLVVYHTFVDSIREFWKKRYQLGISDIYWFEKKELSPSNQSLMIVNSLITPSQYIHEELSIKGTFVKSIGNLARNYGRIKQFLTVNIFDSD
ncbi:glycosyltransferase family 2 protein [Halorubrum sp. BV1]|uniref:glycosyltransferase family 2 protein n=1 Tax=Halorubrum sp. BV1 TaxID=1498500 RepID=UPI0009B5A80B|nr:glycosyltransferase [Halorubrum sp. BV1]